MIDKQNANKRNNIVKLVTLTGVILTVLGITFAAFNFIGVGNNSSIITTGHLELVLDETAGSGITLSNAIPMKDSDGFLLDPYEFTLRNTGTMSSYYTISLALDEEAISANNASANLINFNNVKVQLNNETPVLLSSLTDLALETGEINVGDSNSYTLRLWLDWDAGNEVMNKELYLKLKIEASQGVRTEALAVGDLSLITDGDLLYSNTNRGFRSEAYITLGSGISWPGVDLGGHGITDNNDPVGMLDKNRTFDIGKVNIVQTYVYLSDYIDKPLDDIAFQQLTDYFNDVNDLGVKILLRFAYEYSMDATEGPTVEQIQAHCLQIEEWIDNNIDLFHEVVYGVQFGIIGAWGELHSSVNITLGDVETYKEIVPSVLNMFPSEYSVMARDFWLYEAATTPELKERLSFHHDYLSDLKYGVIWYFEGRNYTFDSPDFITIKNATQSKVSDGELPWGWEAEAKNADLDEFVMILAEYGFTTFSLLHNYQDGLTVSENVLTRAKDHYLSEQFFIDNDIPYNPAMLTNGQISAFDYIDWHLGYLLAITEFDNSNNTISFALNNYGMGTTANHDIKISADGVIIYEGRLEDLNMNQFGYHKFTFDNLSADKIDIEIRHRYNNSPVKLANNLYYKDGVNSIFIN